MAEGNARAEATLGLTLQALDGHLRRFESIPDLLADNDGVRLVLENPSDPAGRMALDQWLSQKNAQLDALDIYVMTPDGVTIAASNFDRADSFIGQNFSYRPYFQSALAGDTGRFFAIGTTSGVRGYYFASPVKDQAGGISGVIAVKIGLDLIEAEWRLQDAKIIVTDSEGIVFLSSDPTWLYKGLLPLTPDRLDRTLESRRYADVRPTALENTRSSDWGVNTITLPDAGGSRREYVVAGQLLPRADWTVQVLLDTRAVHAQARLSALALMLSLGALAAVVVVILQRRARLAERFALQEQGKAELERRVEARTADLARVNRLIEAEVAERRLTEAELRRTQSDLVQAGKLAALGQMSAALSHEINQPLAAARNYADSAAILIERGDAARAKDNIGQILSLIDRMAVIARHLRHVARKPDAPLKDINLTEAVVEALALVGPRLAGGRITVSLPDDLPLVRGGPVRLQQVLVNLLSNAADAVEGVGGAQIAVSADVVAGRVLLKVQDNGPGVPAAIADRIFDPFFTTKRVGSGLGLGLSISYNIMKDFGGDLRVANAPGGGAVFTVELNIARVRGKATE
ncbi:MAG TPA: ATP-binding protein [Albidovulum sp.]|uniref:sensor histidine kinase n=1 Tax=Albidovulum sp. TaxID=1872424 RepID=UPI002CB5051E|nr:ATP-binding protein [Albidovulum sp.]